MSQTQANLFKQVPEYIMEDYYQQIHSISEYLLRKYNIHHFFVSGSASASVLAHELGNLPLYGTHNDWDVYILHKNTHKSTAAIESSEIIHIDTLNRPMNLITISSNAKFLTHTDITNTYDLNCVLTSTEVNNNIVTFRVDKEFIDWCQDTTHTLHIIHKYNGPANIRNIVRMYQKAYELNLPAHKPDYRNLKASVVTTHMWNKIQQQSPWVISKIYDIFEFKSIQNTVWAIPKI